MRNDPIFMLLGPVLLDPVRLASCGGWTVEFLGYMDAASCTWRQAAYTHLRLSKLGAFCRF